MLPSPSQHKDNPESRRATFTYSESRHAPTKKRRVELQPSLRICLCHPSNIYREDRPVENNKTKKNDKTKQNKKCRFQRGDFVYYRNPRQDHRSYHGTFHSVVEKKLCRIRPWEETSSQQGFETVETHRLVPYFSPTQESHHDLNLNGDTSQPPHQKHTTARILLIVTPDTARYRQLAESQLVSTKRSSSNQQATAGTEHILELGCSTGETSKILIPRSLSWIGLDTSQEMIDTVQKRFPNTTCVDTQHNDNSSLAATSSTPQLNTKQCYSTRLDALQDPVRARQLACQFGHPTSVFLDIGGNREAKGVLRMLDFVWNHLVKPGGEGEGQESQSLKQIVVKSQELYQSLLRQQEKASDESSAHESWVIDDVLRWIQNQQELHNNSPMTAAQSESTPHSPSICLSFPRHPLKAPLRVSPDDDSTPICRYHNYHKKGCRRWLEQQEQQQKERTETTTTVAANGDSGTQERSKKEGCNLDHNYCHWCLRKGHRALECPEKSNNHVLGL